MKKIRIVGLLVLVLILCLAACGKKPATTETTQPADTGVTLYYNINRDQVADGMMVRKLSDEGLFRIRLAANGEQKDYFTTSKVLVDQMDNAYIFGLEFDENGYISAVYHPEEITGGYLVENFYVTAMDGDRVTCNSLATGNGLEVTFTLQEETKVYSVGGSALFAGLPCDIHVDDSVTVVKDTDDNITHVFAAAYQEPGTLYWNVEKMYNSTLKITTRPADLIGRYEYTFLVDGEVVTYYTKDSDIANAIDGVTAKCMGLTFDEEGNITGVQSVKEVCGGYALASWYHVTEIAENGEVHFERRSGTNKGATASGFLSKDCKIIDTTEYADPMGSFSELEVGDQVHCIRDARGRICYVFVVGGRTSGVDMYWNVDRDWNKDTLATNRKPQADGYYHFLMAVNGKHINVRVKDLEMANTVENAVCSALKLDENNIVTKVFSANSVYGGSVFGSWYQITALDGNKITCYRKSTDVTVEGEMAEDCVIYDTSSLAVMEGEKITTLRVGDTIHGYTNKAGKIALIYVVTRQANGPVYWNVDRQWDSNNKVSTRTPADDGYYYFTMSAKGKHVTLKSRSKTIANQVDERSCVVLITSGSTITKVLSPATASYTSGGLFGTNYHVTAINGRKITVEMMSGADKGKTLTATLTSSCDVYDVSKSAEVEGQRTTLRVGDQINAFKNKDGQLTLIYVLAASNHDSHTCDCCGKDAKWVAWNGTDKMIDGGHYCASGDMNIYVTVDEGATVTLCLNGMSLNARSNAIAAIPAGVTVNVVDCKGTGSIHGASGRNGAIAQINGGTLNIYGGTYTGVEIAESGKNGGLFAVAAGSMNLYDGTISGGKATGNGGNIALGNATFTMYGGTVENGIAGGSGGNITLGTDGSRVILKGGNIVGGTAGTEGAGISVRAGELIVEGGAVSGEIALINAAKAQLLGGTLSGGVRHTGTGTLILGGNVQITGAEKNLQLDGEGGIALSDTVALAEAVIGLSTAKSGVILSGITREQADCFTLESVGAMSYVPAADTRVGDLVIEALHTHCYCRGAANAPAHTCEDTAVWKPISGTITVSEDAYMFLDWEGSKGAAITVADGVHLRLCLNGAKVIAARTITLGEGSTLTVCDCSEGKTGWISVSGASTRSPILMDKASTVNLMSGTLNGDLNGTPYSAVTMTHADAVLNIYGGAITGIAANNVNVTAGTVNVLGGKVNDIFLGADGNVTVGNAKVGNVYITDGKTLNVTSDFDVTKASVMVTMEDPKDPIVVGITQDISAAFMSVGGEPVLFETDKLVLGVAPHIHCYCRGADVTPEGHTCLDEQGWTPLTTDTTLVDGGHYYLTEDTTSKLTLPTGEITLCLNGYTLSSGAQIVGSFGAGKTVNVCDCGEGGTILGKFNGAAPVGVVAGGTLNLYSGRITANKVTATNKNGGILTMTDGALNIYGGAITGGNTTGYGGNINVSKGVVTMYGGMISNGTSGTYGGCVALSTSNAKFHMYGGTICGGTSGTHGASVGIGYGEFILYDGFILGGAATTNGGTMSANNTSVVKLLGGVIEMGEAAGKGDCLYSGKSNVVLGGTAQVADICLNTDVTLALDAQNPLTGNKTIGITVATGTKFLSTATDLSGVFKSNVSGYAVTFADDGLTLTEGQETVPAPTGIRLLDGQGREVEDTLTLKVGESMTLIPVVDPVTASGVTVAADGIIADGWTFTAEEEGTATVVIRYNGTPLRTLTITITAA